MAKTLISSPSSSIFAAPLPSLHRRGRRGLGSPVYRPRGVETRIKMSFQEVPPLDLSSIVSRAEGILYTLADAAVAADPASGAADAAGAAAQKNGGGLGLSRTPWKRFSRKEYSLRPPVYIDRLGSIRWQDVSQLWLLYLLFIGLYQALSNVANEGLLKVGFLWIPSLAGPTTIAARQSGSGISWLFPFVDGHPPLGWSDTATYLVLLVLLVVSQYFSMEIMKPPQFIGN